jgi:hypothetical protein
MTNQTQADWPAEVRQRVFRHLEEIDKALGAQNIEWVQRRAIVDDVEGQITEMLSARKVGTPTMADIEAILVELDPPASYGASLGGAAAPPPALPVNLPPAKLSRRAVWGAVFAPLVLILGLFFMVRQTTYPQPAAAETATRLPDGRTEYTSGSAPVPPEFYHLGPGPGMKLTIIPVMLLGFASPFLTTFWGIVAIGEIRRSGGRIYGMPLAVADALFYPLVALDALIVFVVVYPAAAIITSLAENGWDGLAHPDFNNEGNMALVCLAGAVVCALVDWILVRKVWKAVRK